MYKKENIKKDFWKIFFPLLVIFYIFIAYNLVDTYFAGWIGEKAIAGLQIAFPMFFLLLAFNEAFGTAINNLSSISLGEKKPKNISKYFSIGLLFSIIFGGLFFIFSENIINLFFLFSGNIDLEVKKYAFLYGNILFKYSFLYIFSGMLWQILIVFKKRKAQIFLAISILILNIILDYIFVKYLNYGIEGIAYATVFTWLFTLLFGVHYIIFKEKITKFTSSFSIKKVKKFVSYATTAFFVMFLAMLAIMVDNYFFGKIGSESLAAYGIGTRLKDFLFYPMISASIAFSVLYGFYYGKRDFETNSNLLSYMLKIGLYYGISLFFIMPIIAKLFGGLFSSSELVIHYLFLYMLFAPIFLLGFILRFIYSTILQIIGYHKTRIVLNILFVFFTFIFEYIFYNIFKSYIGICIGAVIASLTVSYLTYLFYKVKIKDTI